MINNVRKLRLAKGIKIKELSDRLGVGDPARIYRLEQSNDVYLSTALKLAKALDVKIEELFEYDSK